ncbi:hypothetical protein PoB_000570200 [Plakobranchus ocellatus]|uniref:Uncharacterized protein n=1 Tax=Plakobranchus ocellatus TaxID=259542 RepID=A0AAV3Y9R9_9GAST|nr:hypothetical protein PoB_000570200 [Plakobranchus ocellatus]
MDAIKIDESSSSPQGHTSLKLLLQIALHCLRKILFKFLKKGNLCEARSDSTFWTISSPHQQQHLVTTTSFGPTFSQPRFEHIRKKLFNSCNLARFHHQLFSLDSVDCMNKPVLGGADHTTQQLQTRHTQNCCSLLLGGR